MTCSLILIAALTANLAERPRSEGRHDSFYYNQLWTHTRKMFLFRGEYIFDLERATVVEVPQQGHAIYVFSRPANLDQWVRRYGQTAKDDVRRIGATWPDNSASWAVSCTDAIRGLGGCVNSARRS